MIIELMEFLLVDTDLGLVIALVLLFVFFLMMFFKD